jgi:cytochrome c oxidase assembly protein subunit 15
VSANASNLEAASIGDQPMAPAVRRWLLCVWALVLCMVVVGGITRLTGSGLSIVEWKPVAGAIPPLTDIDWNAAFDAYKASPQFRDVNRWMALGDFKRIFLWEYAHRLLGRAIGVVVLLPWIFFWRRGRLSRALARKTAGLFVLGGLQGFLGWYMVQSGLVHEPRVSHYRLAAHLSLAFATGALVLWLALDGMFVRNPERRLAPARLAAVYGLLALFALQVVYGAFMAGTHAGYYYTTFPDLNGTFLPGPSFTGTSWLLDALNSPTAIHYLHRFLGWLVLSYTIGIWVYFRRVEPRPQLWRAAAWVAWLALVQLNLGALTVVQRVALPLAVAHQALAYLFLSSLVLLLHRSLGSAPRI